MGHSASSHNRLGIDMELTEFEGRKLKCGKCDASFTAWRWYHDQDQLTGVGFCYLCQQDLSVEQEEQAEALMNHVQSQLKGAVRNEYDDWTWKNRYNFALACVVDAHIAWTFHKHFDLKPIMHVYLK